MFGNSFKIDLGYSLERKNEMGKGDNNEQIRRQSVFNKYLTLDESRVLKFLNIYEENGKSWSGLGSIGLMP